MLSSIECEAVNGPDRREVLKGAVASLFVPFTVSFAPSRAEAALPTAPAPVGAYLQIDSTNTVTLSIGSTEMEQGIMTGLAQLVAEEMNLSWSQIKVVHALASALTPNPFGNPLFGAQLTGGSTSMRGWYLPIRQAAAIARETLRLAAVKQYGGQWTYGSGGAMTGANASVSSCTLADVVLTAATITPPLASSVSLTTTSNFIGKSTARLDLPAKVTGAAIFGIDVQVPGMVYASVAHCPTLGGTVKTMPAKPANALAIVNLGNAVGVVATDTWSAMQLARSVASSTTWTLPSNLASRDSASIAATAQQLVSSTTATPHVYETSGSVDPITAMAGAAVKLDATYTLPYLAHACMEVLNCTASVTATSCEIWAPTQGQQFCIPTATAITGLSADKITVHTTYLGGGLGRKIEQDYIGQAITISKAVGKPVKLVWSREQDMKNDKYRPCATIRVQAGLDANKAVTGLIFRNVSPSINIQRNTAPGNNPEDTGAVAGALALPYAIANRRIEFVPNPADIPLGYWRSVGESYNTFAVESAIDELALAAKIDPLAYRRSLLANDARALGVINAVDTLSGWSTSAVAQGSARGVAFLKGFGSYIALVVKLSLNASIIRVSNAYCAIDCGVVINPGSVEAQIQSGIAHGLSATLWGQVTFANGVPNVTNFSNYRLLRLSEMPVVSVKIVSSGASPGGVGETGVPCVAPAVANAYAKLTGTRVRSLPFYPGATGGGGDN